MPDSNYVFYVFWRGLNTNNHPVVYVRTLANENSTLTNVTQGWSPSLELHAPEASDVGWPSVGDVWRENRVPAVNVVWPATVGKDEVIEYAHVQYP